MTLNFWSMGYTHKIKDNYNYKTRKHEVEIEGFGNFTYDSDIITLKAAIDLYIFERITEAILAGENEYANDLKKYEIEG